MILFANFKRVKLRTITTLVILLSLTLLVYQIIISYKLSRSNTNSVAERDDIAETVKLLRTFTTPALEIISNPIKLKGSFFDIPRRSLETMKGVKPLLIKTFNGILPNDKKYIPNMNGNIVCAMDSIEIEISRVNDDYCDCVTDGMDEPGTNACSHGIFYCAYQSDPKNSPKFIPSSQVNDGVCDCCDGSDEWKGVVLPHRLSDDFQKTLGRFQSPCLFHC